MVAYHQRSHRGPVTLLDVRNDLVPAYSSILGIERDQVRVGRSEVEPAFEHGHTAMADVITLSGGMAEVPQLVPGVRVDRPDIVWHGEVQNTIDQQRGGLDLGALIGLKGPGKAKVDDILRRDLCKTAVAFAGIISVIERPAIRGWMLYLFGFEILGRGHTRPGDQRECCDRGEHQEMILKFH